MWLRFCGGMKETRAGVSKRAFNSPPPAAWKSANLLRDVEICCVSDLQSKVFVVPQGPSEIQQMCTFIHIYKKTMA